MDKSEIRLQIEAMANFMKEKSYKEALEIADSIHWKKVKNVAVLCAASEVYEANEEYQKGREVLFLAYDIAPDSKKVIYRLGILALKQGELQEAMDCYEEFLMVAPKDSNRFILKYKILKAKQAPIKEQIAVLEEFKAVEYVEKWAYELASLYKEAGMITECLEECDDLILWFSEGKYIYKAMELKMKYKPLTPLQHEKYMSRYEQPKPVQKKVEEEEVQEEPIEEEVAIEVEQEQISEEVLVEEKVEEVQEEQKEEEEVPEKEEIKAPAGSIEKMVQDWEATQKENAQMIQAKFEEVEQEKAKREEEAVPEEEQEEILPNDVRTLMEQLEAESAEISAQKIADGEEVVEEKPLLQKVVEQLSSLDVKLDKSKKEEEVAVEQAPIEEIDEPEEDEGIKLGDTQSIALSTKALQNATRVELVEEEETAPPVVQGEVKKEASPYDTGFVVQGRYDLDVHSEVGIKAGLTEEQKKLFSYFVPVHGMSDQLVKILENDKHCKTRYGTSKVGNVVVVGRRGSGKTVLAVDIVKAIQKQRRVKHGKVAIVKAEALNKKDAREIIVKLHGGALVIENAARLQKSTVEILNTVMEGQTGELLVVMEDERKAIDKLFAEHPDFKSKFTSRIDIPVFLNDELVTFGQTYAKENGYKIDDMGILALYSDIDILQREEKVVTVADVKALIDDAIENAKRPTFKKMVKKMLGKNKDKSDRIILKEEDFR